MHDARRYDSGRNDNPGAELNEERIGRTRRGDAPDEERQSIKPPSRYVEQEIPGICAGNGEGGRAAQVLGEEQDGASVSDCEGFVWLSQDGVSRFVKEPELSVYSVW